MYYQSYASYVQKITCMQIEHLVAEYTDKKKRKTWSVLDAGDSYDIEKTYLRLFYDLDTVLTDFSIFMTVAWKTRFWADGVWGVRDLSYKDGYFVQAYLI